MLKKSVISFILITLFISIIPVNTYALIDEDDVEYDTVAVTKILDSTDIFELKAKGAILIDATTGSILFEGKSNEKLPLASVTKIMSLLLIMEAMDAGKFTYDDMVPVSEHAFGMGGSQVWLEPGEQFTVREMLKAVAIRSANDATVAMAEKVAGSEESFVAMMNSRAKELGMNNTNFLDCTGLAEIENDNHYSTAYDISLMSRELLMKHPGVTEFTSTWQAKFRENVQGKNPVSLDNTNKLVRHYDGTNGLKTGFTRKSGHCLSASAKRNNLQLIAVVLGEPDSSTRFAEARKLLDYGFANYETKHVNERGEQIQQLEVKKGINSKLNIIYSDDVFLLIKKGNQAEIVRELFLNDEISAPIKEGQKLGEIVYTLEEREIGKADVIAETSVERASFIKILRILFVGWLGVGRQL